MCTYYEPVFFKLPSVGDGLGNVKLQSVGLGWVQNFWDGLGFQIAIHIQLWTQYKYPTATVTILQNQAISIN